MPAKMPTYIPGTELPCSSAGILETPLQQEVDNEAFVVQMDNLLGNSEGSQWATVKKAHAFYTAGLRFTP